MQTVVGGKSSPRERFEDLRRLFALHPNKSLCQSLLRNFEDPKLRRPVQNWVLPYASQQGWDPEPRFDGGYATTAVLETLAAARPEDLESVWSNVKDSWELVPADCPDRTTAFRALLKVSRGGSVGALAQKLQRLEHDLELDMPAAASFDLRVRMLGLMLTRGGDFNKELARVQDLTTRLKACPEGLGEGGRTLLDRLDRLPGLGDARDAVFEAYHHLHPEDYSNFIAWHFDPQEVKSLTKLNQVIPYHGFRLPVAREAIRMPGATLEHAFAPIYSGCGDAEAALKMVKRMPADFELNAERGKYLKELTRSGAMDPIQALTVVDHNCVAGASAGGLVQEFCQIQAVCTDRGTPDEATPAFEGLRALQPDASTRAEFLRRLREHGLAGVEFGDLLQGQAETGGPQLNWETDGILVGDHWLPKD